MFLYRICDTLLILKESLISDILPIKNLQRRTNLWQQTLMIISLLSEKGRRSYQKSKKQYPAIKV